MRISDWSSDVCSSDLARRRSIASITKCRSGRKSSAPTAAVHLSKAVASRPISRPNHRQSADTNPTTSIITRTADGCGDGTNLEHVGVKTDAQRLVRAGPDTYDGRRSRTEKDGPCQHR